MDDPSTPRIAAAIPAYQAAPSVGAVVEGARRGLPGVLVVDDGSTRGPSPPAVQPPSARRSGVRHYSSRLLAEVGCPESRFEAESAVVVRAVRRGFRVAAVPVRLGFADGRTTSHYRPLIDSLRIARAVLHARIQALRWGRSS